MSTDREKYAIYKKAQKDGTPCPICNWQDGDGVRTCFYSSELGIVTHQNTEKGVMASMNEAQRHLYRLDQTLAYISEEYRERHIQHIARNHHAYVERMLKQNPDRYPVRDTNDNPISEEAWVARYRAGREKEPLATDPQYTGWIQEPWWQHIRAEDYPPPELRGIEQESSSVRFVAWMTHLYEPHSCGKGHKYQKAPYHFACTGCSTEIKLWEHGVDYDIG